MMFSTPMWFFAIIALAIFYPIVFWIAKKTRQKKMKTFIGNRLNELLLPEDKKRMILRYTIYFLGIISIITALARPLLTEKEEDVQLSGVDFLIAIDVSKSMMAGDTKPAESRLESVKRVVLDLIKDSKGDRIGLIAFAGEARLISPMTNNKSSLALSLEHLTTQTIWRSGSNLEKPIKCAEQFLGKKQMDAKVLVIFSDGEQHDTDPSFAAREAKLNTNLTIFTIGVGSSKGAKVPIIKKDDGGNIVKIEYLKNINDEVVISKLSEMHLRSIARITNGAYAKMRARNINSSSPSVLKMLYDTQIKPLAQSLRVAKIISKQEVFQYPLALAIMLLFLEMLIVSKKTKTKEQA